ncbi:MAG: ROK family protein [Opitutaceae bacterium]|nr:ROK family protein [Opitutaceae bacterium]
MKHALGIDIGGTKTALGVVAENGTIQARTTLPTDSHLGFRNAIQRISIAAGKLFQSCDAAARQLSGIGVGCTGPVNPITGVVDNPHTLPGWDGCNLIEALSAEFNLRTWLENDADTAAYGEYHFGAGEGADRLVMLTFGTGVGGAAILRGEIYRGTRGGHPELGHLPVSNDGPTCYCGRNGCVESFASGPAIAKAASGLGFASAMDVIAADGNNSSASKILMDAREAIATATWSILHSFFPDRIVLGGGLVEAHPEFFVDAARTAVGRARLLDTTSITIAPARLGNLAGLIGAARWAIDQK